MPRTIPEVLSQLSKLDLSKYPYDEIMQNISLMGKFGIIKFTLHPGTSLIRARPNNGTERFFSKNEYSYKPQEYNKTYQRASTPKKTMFYAAYFPEDIKPEDQVMLPRMTAAMETLPWLRDTSTKGFIKISFGRWIVTEDIHLVAVVGNEKFQEASRYTKELSGALNNFVRQHPDLQADTSAINEFFSQEFSKEQTNPDYHYMQSACFAETVSGKGMDGVLYPSVRVGGRGFNVAFVPSKADTLKLVSAGECSIYKLRDRTFIDNDTTIELANGEHTFDLPASRHHVGQDECLRRVGATSIDELLS
jgi:hypothetical protein